MALGASRLVLASPLVFERHFSDLDSSLNVATISLSISMAGVAECVMANCDRPEVDMKSELSGLDASRLVLASPLVFNDISAI